MAHCGIKFQQGVHNKLANICENCAQFCQLTPQNPLPQPPHRTHTRTRIHMQMSHVHQWQRQVLHSQHVCRPDAGNEQVATATQRLV